MPFIVAHPVVSFLRCRAYTKKHGDRAAQKGDAISFRNVHSITSSASARIVGGVSRLSDLADKVEFCRLLGRQLGRFRPFQDFVHQICGATISMEARATAHYWAHELTKLGHEVRLMPAKDVKAHVRRNKNDVADAEAICEAVSRPTMRFVRVKSAEQQVS